jgi:hypothetical protein
LYFLKRANVEKDAGIVEVHDQDICIAKAKTRQGNRQKSLRTLSWQVWTPVEKIHKKGDKP